MFRRIIPILSASSLALALLPSCAVSSAPPGEGPVAEVESSLPKGAPPQGDAWTPLAPEKMSIARANHTSTALEDGRVLVAGGWVAFANLSNTSELYDPLIGKFVSPTPFKNGRWGHRASLLTHPDAKGHVMVTGGELPGNVYLKSAVEYDPGTNTWIERADMLVARRNHATVTLADGRLLVAGGGVTAPQDALVSEIYDPSTKQWHKTMGALNQAREDPKGALLPDGKVIVMGGYAGGPLDTAELFDPMTEQWAMLQSHMLSKRYVFEATPLLNGDVLVSGGGVDGSATPTNLADIYDWKNKQFVATGPMGAPRAYHMATRMACGLVLVAGGDGLSSAEVYDPIARTWSAAGSMSMGRGYAGASALSNGDVLISGGFVTIGGLVPLDTAEVFHYDSTCPAGGVCAAGSDCASGFCADGVCCDTACSAGACDACSVAAGASKDGTCELFTGPSCDDSDACTQSDVCSAGVCIGGSPVVCAAADECHAEGACDSLSGECSNPALPDGSACTKGACQSGACVPESSSSSSGSSSGASSSGSSSSGSSSSGGGVGGDDGRGSGDSEENGGCACSFGGSGDPGALWPGLALLLFMRRRRALNRKFKRSVR